MITLPMAPHYYNVSSFRGQNRSSLVFLIFGIVIFGYVAVSVSYATVLCLFGMGLCFAAFHRVNTVCTGRRW